MTTQTQLLIPQNRLSLDMPTGRGLRKVVEVSCKDMNPALMIAGRQSELAAEDYHNLAAKLLTENYWTGRRVFVTSPAAGDGKTCTAFNLAWALSKQGKSVLLAELNFARPQFRTVLGGLRIWYGIDCALRGSAKPSDSVFSMGGNGVDVCAVRDAARSGQLKEYLPRLDAFLGWFTDKYDWIILDCPAVLSREWNSWFREFADPALLVVREQQTPLVEIRKTTKLLGSQLKGILLNDSVAAIADE